MKRIVKNTPILMMVLAFAGMIAFQALAREEIGDCEGLESWGEDSVEDSLEKDSRQSKVPNRIATVPREIAPQSEGDPTSVQKKALQWTFFVHDANFKIPLPRVTIAFRKDLQIIGLTDEAGRSNSTSNDMEQGELVFQIPMELGGSNEFAAPTAISISKDRTVDVALTTYARIHLTIDGKYERDQEIPVRFLDNRLSKLSESPFRSTRKTNPTTWLLALKNEVQKLHRVLDMGRTVIGGKTTMVDIPHSGEIAIVATTASSSCDPVFITVRPGVEINVTIKTGRRPQISGQLIDKQTKLPLPGWQLDLASYAEFDQGEATPEGKDYVLQPLPDGSGRSFAKSFTIVTTDKDGRFQARLPFSGEVAIWNGRKLEYTTGKNVFQLPTLYSDVGPIEVLVSKIATPQYMQLMLEGEKLEDVKRAQVIEMPLDRFVPNQILLVTPDGRIEVTRLKIGTRYVLAIPRRRDISLSYDFVCEPGGSHNLKERPGLSGK